MTDAQVHLAIIVPQREEYEAVKKIFAIPPRTPAYVLPHGGSYVLSQVETVSPPGQVRFAIACMNDMYNHPSLALTERLLHHLEPKLMFLVGSACGNVGKVRVCDVVVLTESVAYLGRGRLENETVNPRPYTVQVEREIRDAITIYMTYHADHFNQWNRRCRRVLRDISASSPIPAHLMSSSRRFQVKPGIIASDDMVLSWGSDADAGIFWNRSRHDAKAYDMESAGFSHGCSDRTARPRWTVIRGISDHGIQGTDKCHLAAAAVAAEWLRGFILRGLGELHPTGSSTPEPDVFLTPDTYDWDKLYSQMEAEEGRNLFVGKGAFIRGVLRGERRDIQALAYAIGKGGIIEYEIASRTGRPTTAMKLDKESTFWVEYRHQH